MTSSFAPSQNSDNGFEYQTGTETTGGLPGPELTGTMPGPDNTESSTGSEDPGTLPGDGTTGSESGPELTGTMPGPDNTESSPGPEDPGTLPGDGTSGSESGPELTGTMPGPDGTESSPGPEDPGTLPGDGTSGSESGPVNPVPSTPLGQPILFLTPETEKQSRQLENGPIGATYRYRIYRSGDISETSTVDWSVVGSGAFPASDSDFANGEYPGGTVSFAIGQRVATIEVVLQADGDVEPQEQFRIQLSNPTGALIGGALDVEGQPAMSGRSTQEWRNSNAFAALRSDGSVVSWGDNLAGGDSSLVADSLSSGVVELYASAQAFAALKDDGSVVTWGSQWSGGDSSNVGSSLSSGVRKIISGSNAFAALKDDGSVITWGDEYYGGNSSNVADDLAGEVTNIFTTGNAFAALRSDGSVVTWGADYVGGNSSTVSDQLSSGVVNISASMGAFAALKEDGSVVSWGSEYSGGNSLPVASKLSDGVKEIVSSFNAFAAIRHDGSVVTWGHSMTTQLGSETTNQLSSGVTSVVSNGSAFAALKEDGSVVTWGSSMSGGDSTGVAEFLDHGVTSIVGTSNAFAALKSDGSVITWGSDDEGGNSDSVSDQLASGVTRIVANNGAFAALKTNGQVVTWGGAWSGGDSASVAAQISVDVTDIYTNGYAFAAVRSDGSVVTWGSPYGGGNSAGIDFNGPDDNLMVVAMATPLASQRLQLGTAALTATILNDDNLSISGNSGSVDEDDIQEVSGTITSSDPDTADQISWGTPESGDRTLVGRYGTLTLEAGTSNWSYRLASGNDLNAGAVQALKADEVVVDRFSVQGVLSNGARTQLPISIEITGANDAPSLSQAEVLTTRPYWMQVGAASTPVDLRERQEAITLPISGTDDASTNLSLDGRTFSFFGQEYSQIYVSNNGLISFNTNSDWQNSDLSWSTLIAPFWDDLATWETDAAVRYTISDEQLLIEWRDLQRYSPSPVTFQASLELNTGNANGRIRFNYIDTDYGDVDFDDGASATAGISYQSPGQYDTYLFSYNQPRLQSGTAVEFIPVTPGEFNTYRIQSGDDSQDLAPRFGKLNILDPDTGNSFTAHVEGDGYAELDGQPFILPASAEALLASEALSLSINTDSGQGVVTYSYDPGAALFDFLEEDQTLTITYNVMINDGQDDSQTQPITIRFKTAGPPLSLQPLESPDSYQENEENIDDLYWYDQWPSQDLEAITGSLSISGADPTTPLALVQVAGRAKLSLDGQDSSINDDDWDHPYWYSFDTLTRSSALSVDPVTVAPDGSGILSYTYDPGPAMLHMLRQGQELTITYQLRLQDGVQVSDWSDVSFTITGSNDAPQLSWISTPYTPTQVQTGTTSTDLAPITGALSVLEKDDGDPLNAIIDPNVTVTLNGQPFDLPESAAALTAAGALQIESAVKESANYYGHTPLSYTYDPQSADLSFLNPNDLLSLTYSVSVSDGLESSNKQTLTINLQGRNDAPVLSGDFSGHVKEDQETTVSGTLLATDPNPGTGLYWSNSYYGSTYYGTYGVLTLSTNSDSDSDPTTTNISWTYETYSNYYYNYYYNYNNVQVLKEGQEATDSFWISASDSYGAWSSSQPITITVVGTNDAPTLGQPQSSGRYEIQTLAATPIDLDRTPGTTVLNLIGDTGATWIDLQGHHFSYYNQSLSGLYVDINGLISPYYPYNPNSNNDLKHEYKIAPFWDDLRTETNSEIRYNIVDNSLVVEWKNISPYFASGEDTSITFQAVLELDTLNSNGKITFNYLDTETSHDSDSNGQSATSGISSNYYNYFNGFSSNEKQLFSYNVPSLNSGLAVQFSPVDQTTFNNYRISSSDQPLDLPQRSGQILFADLDNSDTYTVKVDGPARVLFNDGTSASGSSDGFTLPASAAALLAPEALKLSISETSSEGGVVSYAYNPAPALFDFLSPGQSLTITYNIVVHDGHQDSAPQDLTFTFHGVYAPLNVEIVEHPPAVDEAPDAASQSLGPISGSLTIPDQGADPSVQTVLEGDGVLSINGQRVSWNSLPWNHPFHSLISQLTPMGALSFGIPDPTDDGHLVLPFTYDPGSIALDALADDETATVTFRVQVVAGNSASEWQDITITIHGSNDVPVLSSIAPPTAIQEAPDSSAQDIGPISGQLQLSDRDTNDTPTASIVGTPTITLNGESFTLPEGATSLLTSDALVFGSAYSPYELYDVRKISYTYDPSSADLSFLKAGDVLEITYQLQVSDSQQLSESQPLTITILGHNDAPQITGTITGSVSEDNDLSAQGTLTATDADPGSGLIWSHPYSGSFDNTLWGRFGSLTLSSDPDGNPDTSDAGWRYELYTSTNAANSWSWQELQALSAEESREETFVVQVSDGFNTTQQSIKVTLQGSNDKPVLAAPEAIQLPSYRIETNNSPALDLDATPGTVTLDLFGDDTYTFVNLQGQQFNLFGQTLQGVYISTNGLISGYGNSAYNNNNAPQQSIVAPFWDDLFAASNSTQIRYNIIANQLIVEWRDIRHLSLGTEDGITFQATLELNTPGRDGAVQFHYSDVSFADPDFDKGASATSGLVGVHDGILERYLLSENSAQLTDGLSVQFTPISTDASNVYEFNSFEVVATNQEQDLLARKGLILISDPDHNAIFNARVDGLATVQLNGQEFSLPTTASALASLEALTLSVAPRSNDPGTAKSDAVFYTYDPGLALLDFLTPGQELTITYSVVVNDGHEDSAPQPLTFRFVGAAVAEVSDLTIKALTGDNTAPLKAGDVIETTVSFTRTIQLTGSPTLTLVVGDRIREAAYVSGNGTDVLRFHYTIAAGDNDADGLAIAANSLSLQGGTLLDLAGRQADLQHSGIDDQSDLLVDTANPLVQSVGFSGTDGAINGRLNAGDVIEASITLSETVQLSGSPTLTLVVGDQLREAAYVSGDGSDVLRFHYTITAGDNDADGLTIAANSLSLHGGTLLDLAGNQADLQHAGIDNQSNLLVDTDTPLVQSVVFSGTDGEINGRLNAGDVIEASITLSEAVQLSDSATLTLVVGDQLREAAYLSGNGTRDLRFAYTIAAGDHDPDGLTIAANSLSLQGGTLLDLAGNQADLQHAGIDNQNNLLVDTDTPLVQSVGFSGTNGAINGRLNAGDVIEATITLSETVQLSDTATLNLIVGDQLREAAYVSGNGTNVLRFSYTIAAGDNDTDGLAIAANSLSLQGGTLLDLAGNQADLQHAGIDNQSNLLVDTTDPEAPRVALGAGISTVANATKATQQSGVVSVTGEVGSSIQVSFSRVGGGTVVKTVSGNGDVPVAVRLLADDLPKLGNGTVLVQAVATDLAGNTSPTGTAQFTLSIPAVVGTSITATGVLNNTLNVNDVVSVNVSMNTAVVVTGKPQLKLNIGGIAKAAEYVSGSGTSSLIFRYTIQPSDTDLDGLGIVGNSLTLNGGTLKDLTGNPVDLSLPASGDNPGFLVDTSAPDAPAILAVATDDKINSAEKAAGVVVGGTAEAGSTVSITWGVGPSRQVIANDQGAWSTTYSAQSIPGDSTSSTITAVATDRAGNRSPVSSRSVLIETRPPSAPVINTVATDNRISAQEKSAGVVLSGSMSAGNSIEISWGSFSRTIAAPTPFATRWTTTVAAEDVPEDNAASVLSIFSRSIAGNLSATTTRTVAIDTSIPIFTSAAITAATGIQNNTLNAGDVVTITLSTSKDVSVTGSPKLNLLVGGTTIVATYTPTGSSATSLKFTAAITAGMADIDGLSIPAQTLNLNGGSIKDQSGNPARLDLLEIGPNPDYLVDTSNPLAPTIAMVASDDRINASEKADGINISGTAEALSSVEITWGLASTRQVVADESGTWNAIYDSTSVPADKLASTISVVSVDRGGNRSSTTQRSVLIDTLAPTAPVISAIATDNVVNAAEKAAGVVVSGTMAAGSSVEINWGSFSRTLQPTTATATSWSTVIAAEHIPADGINAMLQVQARDAVGNASAITSRAVSIETLSPVFSSATITSATGLQNNFLNAGDVVTITLNASKGVSVIGSPSLNLMVGNTLLKATYSAAASTSTALRFTATISAGHTDENGLSIPAQTLNLNGGSIRDNAGNNANLTVPQSSDNGGYLVDTLAPSAPTPTPYSFGGDLSGTAEASATVIVLNGQTELGRTTVNPSGSWSYGFSEANRQALGRTGNVSLSLKTQDLAGNVSRAASTSAIRRTSSTSADTLTGINSNDSFQLSTLSDSRLSAFDTITGYTSSQQLNAPGSIPSTTISSSKGNLVVNSISELANKGAEITTLLNNQFAANTAAGFLVRQGSAQGTVLGTAVVFNDSTAGFSAKWDALYFLQGYSLSSSSTIGVI